MNLPHSVAEILKNHVTFQLESIDRMYLNVYVPALQYEGGVVKFFRSHRGQPIASSALMEPMTKSFVAATERFAQEHDVPLIQFEKGQRKDEVMAEQLRHFDHSEGVVFIGVSRPLSLDSSLHCHGQPLLLVFVDRDFGPFFLQFC